MAVIYKFKSGDFENYHFKNGSYFENCHFKDGGNL